MDDYLSYGEMVSLADKETSSNQLLLELNCWDSNSSINSNSLSPAKSSRAASIGSSSSVSRISRRSEQLLHRHHKEQLANAESMVDNKLVTHQVHNNQGQRRRNDKLISKTNKLISQRLKKQASFYASNNLEKSQNKKRRSLAPLFKYNSLNDIDNYSIGSNESILDVHNFTSLKSRYYNDAGNKLLTNIVQAKTASTDLLQNGYENLYLYGDCLTKGITNQNSSHSSDYPNTANRPKIRLHRKGSLKPLVLKSPPLTRGSSTKDFSDHDMSPKNSFKNRNNREKLLASTVMSVISNPGLKRTEKEKKDDEYDELYNVDVFSYDITSMIIRVTEKVGEVPIYLI